MKEHLSLSFRRCAFASRSHLELAVLCLLHGSSSHAYATVQGWGWTFLQNQLSLQLKDVLIESSYHHHENFSHLSVGMHSPNSWVGLGTPDSFIPSLTKLNGLHVPRHLTLHHC